MEYFETLRARINSKLKQIGTKYARRQIDDYPWLYGALGQVPSDVMFVCENPSLNGVEKANNRTLSGGGPTIEDQWCGGLRSNCIKRFRPALCDLGLKTTGPLDPGGWRCYITNVIKEADVVREFETRDKGRIAAQWADVLNWEIRNVAPRTIFTVGDAATRLVQLLQRQNLISTSAALHKIMHYSNRGAGVTDEMVKTSIVRDITTALGRRTASAPKP
jgi:uracil DNA glycosylase superfamily protein